MTPDLAVGIAFFVTGMASSAVLIQRDLRRQRRRRDEETW